MVTDFQEEMSLGLPLECQLADEVISITGDALPAMGGVVGQQSIENTNSREHSTVETGASLTSGAVLHRRDKGKKKRRKKKRSGSAASGAKSTVASEMPELEKEEDDLDLDLKRMKFDPNNEQEMAEVLAALHDLDILRHMRHEEVDVQENLKLVEACIASTKKEDEEQEGGSALSARTGGASRISNSKSAAQGMEAAAVAAALEEQAVLAAKCEAAMVAEQAVLGAEREAAIKSRVIAMLPTSDWATLLPPAREGMSMNRTSP